MCHMSCLEFGKRALFREEIEGKKIIEVGSLNINGSLRDMVIKYNPNSYAGIDLTQGPGVDMI